MEQENVADQKHRKLKSTVSDSLIQIQRFFSNDDVARILDIDADVINKQIKRHSIPTEYFEKYVSAWKKTVKKPRTPAVIEMSDTQWDKLKNECLIPMGEKILRIWNSFNNSHVISAVLKNKNALDGKSVRFPYLLDKCLNAFVTITADDVAFLCHFFKGDKNKRNVMLQKMDRAKIVAPNHIISILTSTDGQNWILAHKLYSSKIKREESVQNDWIECTEKIQLWIKDNSFIRANETEQPYNVLPFLQFLELIWPEEGETDTKFGPEEIKALIVFKYFLTEEAQQNLWDELQVDYA